MVIKITCSEAVVGAILSTLSAIDACGGTEVVNVEVVGETLPPRTLPSRVHYTATEPEAATSIIAKLGSTTIKGLVYQSVVKATVDGVPVSERDIIAAHRLNANSVQGALVKLRQDDLIKSNAIDTK